MASNSGSAYIYKIKPDGSVSLLEVVTHPNGKSSDRLGISVGTSGRFTIVGTDYFDPPPDKWNAGGPFFSVLVYNFKTALHIRDMLMLNILMKKALAVTAGMLGTLSLLNGALVQVQQVSSPAGHLDNTQVVETGTSFKTVQPNLSSNGYFLDIGQMEIIDSRIQAEDPLPWQPF